MNDKLHMDAADPLHMMDGNNIIQCHTPLQDPELVDKYKDKFVLVCGFDEVLPTAIEYGYPNAIHVDELAAVYPGAVPMDIPM